MPTYLLAGLITFVLLFSWPLAWGQPVPATDVPRVVFPLTVHGNVTTVGARTVDAANAARFSFGVASNGAVFADTGADLPTPGGKSIPIGVAGSVPKASVAGAVGRFAAKAAGSLVGVIGVGVALYDLARELGFTVDNSAGPVTVTRDLVGFDGYEYRLQGSTYAWSPTAAAAAAYLGTVLGSPMVLIPDYPSAGPHNFGAQRANGTGAIYTLSSRVASAPPPPTPSTPQELADAVAEKSGWPSSSALARTLKDAIKYGEVVPVQPEAVSGPATSPGTSTVADNVPAPGQRTRVEEEHQHNYDEDKVTTTTTRTTTVEDIATGAPIGSPQVTTETPALPRPQEQPEIEIETCGLPGKPACKIDEEGTPPAPELDPAQDVLDAQKPLQDLIDDPASVLPELPTMNWTFALPTACGSISTPAFAPYLEAIDVCQFQPLFHDLMSVVWVIGGIFGAIGTFWRNVFSQG